MRFGSPRLVQLTLILTFAALMVPADTFGPPMADGAGAVYRWAFVAAMAMLGTIVVVGGRVAAGMLDRTGQWRVVQNQERLRTVVRVLALGLHVWAVGATGWYEWWLETFAGLAGPAALVAAAPMLSVIVAGWIGMYPIERRLHDASVLSGLDEGRPVYPPLSLMAFVALQSRHQLVIVLLPIFALLCWGDATSAVLLGLADPDGAGPLRWLATPDGFDTARGVLQLVGVGVAMVLFPLALGWLWRTSPLPEGEAGADLGDIARAEGVAPSSVRIWHTEGTMVNALMVGVTRLSRRIYLSDVLVDRLPRLQVLAVLGHEIGHARRRHVPWMIGAALAVGAWATLAVEWAARATGLGIGADAHPAAWMVVLPVAVVLWSFGVVSRRFEWQADAFAVAALSRRGSSAVASTEAVHAVGGALLSVARLNHAPVRRFGWRHGSIAERVERIASLEGTPLDKFPIDRQARLLKLATAVLLVSAIAFAAATGSL